MRHTLLNTTSLATPMISGITSSTTTLIAGTTSLRTLISCSSILVTKMKGKKNKFVSYKLITVKWIQTLLNVWLCDQQIKRQTKFKDGNEWMKMKKSSQTMEIMNCHEWKNEREMIYLHKLWNLPSKRPCKRWWMVMESDHLERWRWWWLRRLRNWFDVCE